METEPVTGTLVCKIDDITGAKYENARDISVESESITNLMDFSIPTPGALMKVRRASEMIETEGTCVPPILTETGAALNPPKFTPPTKIRLCAVVGEDTGNTENINGWLYVKA